MIWFMYGIILCVAVGTVIWANEHKKKNSQDRRAVQEMLDYIEKNYP